jgi:hypothetical protein
MIYVGIDDTDTPESPGTNQLARFLVARLAADFPCLLITRHQLLVDPRVPYTSHNGCASILLRASGSRTRYELVQRLQQGMREWFIEGSDPGLCVTEAVPPDVSAFGQRCQETVVTQDQARALASAWNIHLEGLGGSQDGVIGALAAVGLAATGNDGRVVQIGSWPDDLSGDCSVETLRNRRVQVHCEATDQAVTQGVVDVGKHLRPNRRVGKIILFVVPDGTGGVGPERWQAVRRP